MIRVVQVGLGPLGQKVVQYTLPREGIEIVGAVDPDPEKAGKDVGELCGGDSLGITIKKSLSEVSSEADAAIVTTLSDLQKVEQQITALAAAGLDIVSTCEELSFPWQTQAETARRIDKTCQEHGVTCLGTGVNPGFLMDYLPAVLSSVCQKVERVEVHRVQDASSRRIPFQQKIGAGLSKEEFKAKEREGSLRHVGLPESVYMIAGAMNWKLDRVEEILEPVMADRTITSGYTDIEPGAACGLEQIGKGFIGDREVIRLHFRAAVGEAQSYDQVKVKGTPSFTSTIDGGVNGDVATSAITLNALASILKAGPGLKTMLDIPVPAYSKNYNSFRF